MRWRWPRRTADRVSAGVVSLDVPPPKGCGVFVVADAPAPGVDPPRVSLRPPARPVQSEADGYRREAAFALEKARQSCGDDRDRWTAIARVYADLAGQVEP